MTSLPTRFGVIATLVLTCALAAQVNPGTVMKKAQEQGAAVKDAGAKRAAAIAEAQKETAPKQTKKEAAPPASSKTAPAPQKEAKKEAKKEEKKMTAGAAKKEPPKKQAAPAPATRTSAQARPGERHDPFQVPLKKQNRNEPPPVLPPGNAGLLISQANLQGITKTPREKIAMVVGQGGRIYFLRENDKVWNGRVAKITNDSIIFEESVIDPLGRTSMRQIEKKLPAEAK